MKTKLFFALLFTTIISFAQIVNIPDANLKAKLLAASPSNTIAKNLAWNYFKIDANNDGEIQNSEAEQVIDLDLSSSSIQSLVGIQSFINLLNLSCQYNQLSQLDVTGLTQLKILYCFSNQLTQLDVSGLNQLRELYCNNNQLTQLDDSGLINLRFLYCDSNQFTQLDVSDLTMLQWLDCSFNQLIQLNIKNGRFDSVLYFNYNPNLQYICADEVDFVRVQNKLNEYGYTNCNVNSYCSFTPGGDFYTIQGTTTFDNENNGCDTNDVILPNLRLNITDGTNSGSFISNTTGNYTIPLQAGTYSITPVLENPSYFNINPNSFDVNLTSTSNPYNQNICLSPNGLHKDVEITLIPTSPARPGFDATYRLIYKNKGTITANGVIKVDFSANPDVMHFQSANPTITSSSTTELLWNYTNLQPFETRVIDFTMHLNAPTATPPLLGGDYLGIAALILLNEGEDEYYQDNNSQLKQLVVNSVDPNDKTCLEGTIVSTEKIGEYLHYLIRFENTGTYPATNVVVKDMIDTNVFDISTLQIIQTSHNCVTKITNPDKVEFIFENINLPFDDATNDGYVAFKIKTKPTVSVGTELKNKADIFFDYNFPVTTNEFLTTIQVMGTDETVVPPIEIYPNPVKEILYFKTDEIILKIEVFDVVGRILQSHSVSQNQTNLRELKSGNYLLKLFTQKGVSMSKIVKE